MNAYLLLPLIQTLFSLVLIAVVLKGHWRSFSHRLFSSFMLGLAIWGIIIFGMRASPDLEHAYFWERFLIPLGPLISVLFYHFSIQYTATKIKRWCLPLLYVVSICFIPLATTGFVFSGMQLKPYGYAPVFGPAAGFHMLFSMGIQLIALLTFIKNYRSSLYTEERNRSAYIIIGVIFAAVGAIFDALPILGLPLYPGLIIGNIIFCSLTTVAIVRYNLLDISVVFRKGIAYVLTSAVVAVPFVGLFVLTTKVFAEKQFPLWGYFIVAIIMVFLLPQLWRWFQWQVDRWFYRNRYDYLKALETFSQETQSVTDSARLGSTMVNLLTGALRASSVYVLQPYPPSGDFTIAFSSDLHHSSSHIMLKGSSALVKWLDRSKEMLSYDDMDIIPQLQGITAEERGLLQRLRTKFIIGLKTPTGRLSGLLILGPKLSEQPYTIEDKQLIYAVSSQAAINLENARLYSESQRELMERKRAEEILREYQRAVEGSEELIAVVDQEYTYRIANEAFLRYNRLNRDQVIGHTAVEILGEGVFSETVKPNIDRCLKGEAVEFEMQRTYPGLGERYLNTRYYPLKNSDKETVAVVAIIIDITERKRMEEELEESHEQLRNLSAHIESMREAERTSIAREVHDELGQALTAVKMDISWLNKRLPREQEELTRKTGEMSRLIDTTIQTVKRISTELRPGVLDDLGLMAAIEWQVQEFQERTRIKCELTAEGEDLNLDRDLATGVFRILQEALTNVSRHANAKRVEVSLKEKAGQLVLEVRDNGKGITEKQIAHPKSFGLIGMRERARSWNGSVKIEGIPGKGTVVTVNIPLNQKGEHDDKNTSR